MSDYTQVTAFTPKDSLVSGNPSKVIKGSEFDAEFAAISASLQTKADKTGASFTGSISTTGNLTVDGNFSVAGSIAGVDKSDVGLGNVDNTSDANKPVSTATQAALDLKLNAANPSYTGTLTGGTGVINIGSGQFVKDASGFIGIGIASPTERLDVNGNIATEGADSGVILGKNQGGGASLKYNSNGNLDITPRSGFNTVVTAGSLLVGTTSANSRKFFVKGSGASLSYFASFENDQTSNPFGIDIRYSAVSPNNTSNQFLDCRDPTTTRLQIQSDGTVRNVTGVYGTISDLKLKENITDASPKLAKLMQVRIVNYTLKFDPLKTKLIGVVAQELEQISPGLVEESPDFEEVTKTREVEVPAVEAVLDDEGNEVTPAVEATTRTEEYTERVPTGTVTKSVKYSVFVPMLIKGMQEQQAQIEAMQAQLDTQNHAIALLTARLEALEAA